VSALDVSIQAEILTLLEQIQETFGLTVVVISHNLSVIREVCDRVAVMYLGEFVEVGPTEEVFSNPEHPYTRALISSIPTPDPSERGMGIELHGDVPSPSSPPSGCRFHTRCPEVIIPDEASVDREMFRRILELRQRVMSRAADIESVRESLAVELNYEEPEDVPREEVVQQLRVEYELGDSLQAPEAEAAIGEAFEALVDEEFEEAGEILADAFRTPCEETHPELETVGEDHTAACLLHNEEFADETRRQELYSDD